MYRRKGKARICFLGLVSVLMGWAGPAIAQSYGEELISAGSTWKYWDDSHLSGVAWRTEEGFADDWSSGPAPLGYGDEGLQTLVQRGSGSRITTYFQKSFFVESPRDYAQLELHIRRDDGALVYINNSLAAVTNMGRNVVVAQPESLADSTVSDWQEEVFYTHTVKSLLLKSGENTVSVEVHQSTPDSSDLVFDLRLVAVKNVSFLNLLKLEDGSLPAMQDNTYVVGDRHLYVANEDDGRIDYYHRESAREPWRNGVAVQNPLDATWGGSFRMASSGDRLAVVSRKLVVLRKTGDENWITEYVTEEGFDTDGSSWDTIALNSRHLLAATSDVGKVLCFHRSAEGWQPVQTLTGDKFFGYRIEIFGDVAAVSSPKQQGGSVFLYNWSNNGQWEVAGEIKAPHGGFFGQDISMSGNELMVASRGFPGHVYFYERSIFGGWRLTDLFSSGTGESNSHFGNSVAMRGRFAAATEPFEVGPRVKLFEKRGGKWTQTGFTRGSAMLDFYEDAVVTLTGGDVFVSGVRLFDNRGEGAMLVHSWLDPIVMTSDMPPVAKADIPYRFEMVFEPAEDVASVSALRIPDWMTLKTLGNGVVELSGSPTTSHVGAVEEVILEAVSVDGYPLRRTFEIEVVTGEAGPEFLRQPQSLKTVVGRQARFEVVSKTDANVQWYFEDQAIEGAHETVLEIASVEETDAGVYHATLTNANGSAVSNRVALNILPYDPAEVVFVPDDYRDIDEAMAAARDNGVVLVRPGVYAGNPDWNERRIDLVSVEGPETTKLQGGGVLQPGPGSKIEGFSLLSFQSIEGDNLAIRGNRFVVSDSIQYAPSCSVSGGLVDGNVFKGRSKDSGDTRSFLLEVGPEPVTVSNNLFVEGASPALKVFGPCSANHNVFVNNNNAVVFEEPVLGDSVIANNIFLDNTYAVKVSAIIRDVSDLVLSSVHHNLFLRNGFEGLLDPSGIHGNVTGDPRFVDPVREDYRLLSGSPAAGAGIYIPDAPLDAEGNRRDVETPDIGRFEQTGDETPPRIRANLPGVHMVAFPVLHPGTATVELSGLDARWAVSAKPDWLSLSQSEGTLPTLLTLQIKEEADFGSGGRKLRFESDSGQTLDFPVFVETTNDLIGPTIRSHDGRKTVYYGRQLLVVDNKSQEVAPLRAYGAVAWSRDDKLIFVFNKGGNSTSVFDAENLKLVRVLPGISASWATALEDQAMFVLSGTQSFLMSASGEITITGDQRITVNYAAHPSGSDDYYLISSGRLVHCKIDQKSGRLTELEEVVASGRVWVSSDGSRVLAGDSMYDADLNVLRTFEQNIVGMSSDGRYAIAATGVIDLDNGNQVSVFPYQLSIALAVNDEQESFLINGLGVRYERRTLASLLRNRPSSMDEGIESVSVSPSGHVTLVVLKPTEAGDLFFVETSRDGKFWQKVGDGAILFSNPGRNYLSFPFDVQRYEFGLFRVRYVSD